MNDFELRQQITAIASRFRLFECAECAAAIQQFLIAKNISGKSILFFTGNTKEPFCNIYHERLQENISTNGRHEAIAVEIDGQELIFDNIHSSGISRVNWMNNLYCPIQDLGETVQITETEF
jgi:Papain fold toxin 2